MHDYKDTSPVSPSIKIMVDRLGDYVIVLEVN